jgi:hypothetical protein
MVFILLLSQANCFSNEVSVEVSKKGSFLHYDVDIKESVTEIKLLDSSIPIAQQWDFVDSKFSIKEGVISRIDGVEFEKFSVVISNKYKDGEIDRKYTPVLRSIYGDYYIYSRQFEFVGLDTNVKLISRGANVLVDGVLYNDASTVDLNKVSAGYFGLGQLNLVQSSLFDIIYESGTPDWQVKLVKTVADKVISFNERLFKRKIEKIFIILSNGQGNGFRGDAHPRSVRLNFQGDFLHENEHNLKTLMSFVSHELTHLWTRDSSAIVDEKDSVWMSEGTTELISIRALFQSGLITKKQYIEQLQTRTMGCEFISQRLQSNYFSLARENSSMAYDCGVLLVILLEKYAGHSIEKLAIYKSELNERDSIVIAGIDIDNFHAWVLSELNNSHEKFSKAPAVWNYLISGYLIKEVIRDDCHGNLSISGYSSHYLVSKISHCNTLKKDLIVRQLDGKYIEEDGFDIYRKVVDHCRLSKNGTASLSIEGTEFPVQCKQLFDFEMPLNIAFN